MPNYWWVNQGQTFNQEVGGGYLWAPKTQRDGTSLASYNLMLELEPGDIVFSHSKGKIAARGVVKSAAISSHQPPDLLKIGDSLWNNDGWLVGVDFEIANEPAETKDLVSQIMPLMLEEYPKPLAKNGFASQKNYLTRISPRLAELLTRSLKMGSLDDAAVRRVSDPLVEDVFETFGADLGALSTDKQQLILARRGQGIFRERVLNFEKVCRVTGIEETRLLIASHIKPWAQSTDLERMNGANGLMLSPHFDKLFDLGLMTFKNDGTILYSTGIAIETRLRWTLEKYVEVGKFNKLQQHFLEFHRDTKFLP